VQLDKQIHRHDFRLRMLVTNACDKKCYHCLNDFQDKPKNGPLHLDVDVGIKAIQSYCDFTDSKSTYGRLDISGGEPGVYPDLKELLVEASKHHVFIKINTNGLALDLELEKLVNCWHVSVTENDPELRDKVSAVKGTIQYVVTYANLSNARNIVEFYGSYGIPIKLFIDVYSDGKERQKIQNIIIGIIKYYGSWPITTRFVGVQENRGKLCEGCTKTCITLKALWIFPDGTASYCPQRTIQTMAFNEDMIEQAYLGHKVN